MRNGRTCAIYDIFSLHLTGQQQQQRSTFSRLFENHCSYKPLGVHFGQHGTPTQATTEATKSRVDIGLGQLLTY